MKIKFLNIDEYDKWDDFCYKNSNGTFSYTSNVIEYNINSNFNITATNKSFFVLNDNKEVVGVMVVFIEECKEKKYLAYGGGPLLAPLISDKVNKKTRQKALSFIIETIDNLALDINVEKIEMIIPYQNVTYIESIDKHNYLLKYNGFLDISRQTSVISILKDEKSIFSGFNKGFKSCINKADRYLTSKIIDYANINDEDVHKFMKYYFNIAGKVTRPKNTFENIYRWIVNNHAILVETSYNGEVVGYILFHYYKDVAYYAMGCKSKNYKEFDFEISHIMIWEAIKYLKSLNIKYIDLGIQDYNDTIGYFPTQKDKSISDFKRGFGGFTVPAFIAEKFYIKESFFDSYYKRIKEYEKRNFIND
ncbi:GNAT family N-acetyltransferase [Clostridium sp. CMCC3677]|uniref:GNAT family N-acetyltransferase n=1 Tax=Clostridium sp. CMCC3677 TaxID=2949963 RepID=UPI0013F0188F|nr:GNAT family N-acetyltransferase [Clostridium sp. CMCC3677]NFG60638.1 GNAT family N-acetyltransferase [Clostridium botulinum]NFQ10576.1 GNAT family N-acetyltransferase [Clostridium botulinum]